MTKQEYETLRDAAAYSYDIPSHRNCFGCCQSDGDYINAFNAGADFAYDLMQSRISELEDKLYHESRKAPEVEYKLGHKIEQLEAKLAICKTALEDMTWSVDRRTAGIAKGTLAQLEGKGKGE